MTERIRLGILGTGHQAVTLLKSSSTMEGDVQIVSVASRSLDTAKSFADKWEIPRAYGGYETLIADPLVDAVYIATPNSEHAKWAVACLDAGKHVLVERPLACNGAEARAVAETAQRTGCVAMEALGYKFHPFFKRVREIIEKGEIGAITNATARFFMPTLSGKNWRYSYELGGGAMMDTGEVALDAVRHVMGDVSLVCTEAKCKTAYPNIDQDMTCEFLATNSATAVVDCSIWSLGPRISLVVKGESGAEITARNWESPHLLYNAILVTDTSGCKRVEKFETGDPTVATLQLKAFIECIRNREKPNIASADNAVANLDLIDSVYEKAGMIPRGRADQNRQDQPDQQS